MPVDGGLLVSSKGSRSNRRCDLKGGSSALDITCIISDTYEYIGKCSGRESENDQGCSEHHSSRYGVKRNVIVGLESVRVARRQTRSLWTLETLKDGGTI